MFRRTLIGLFALLALAPFGPFPLRANRDPVTCCEKRLDCCHRGIACCGRTPRPKPCCKFGAACCKWTSPCCRAR